jgi:endonuclease III
MIQDELKGQPDYGWRTLVACVLMNRATAAQVRPVLRNVLARWPRPQDMANASEAELSRILRPTGFCHTRAARLTRMSREFQQGIPVTGLTGVGPYALESWRIFVEEDLGFTPKDKKLKSYVEGRRP